MTKLRLKPALGYQLDYMFWASIIAFAIAIAAFLLLFALFGVTSYTESVTVVNEVITENDLGEFVTIDDDRVNVEIGSIQLDFYIDGRSGSAGIHFNFVGIFAMMLFIIGIAGVREDLRFFLQHGMGRMTTFVSTLITSLIIGVVYALISELLLLALSNWTTFNIQGFRTDAGFFGRWLSGSLMLYLIWQLGTLISLIYYRMNKLAKIIFSIAAGATILIVIPRLISNFFEQIIGFFFNNNAHFFASPLGTTLIHLGLAIIITLGNFLLIRRAPIKEFS